MGTNNKGIYCMYVYVVSCVVSNFTVTGGNDANRSKVMMTLELTQVMHSSEDRP